MREVVNLLLGAAVLVALTSRSFGETAVPYFEDVESVNTGDYVSQTDVWQLVHHDNGPIVSDDKAFSGGQSLSDQGDNVGMLTTPSPDSPFADGPLTGDQAGISFMWYKEDHGEDGEDDRIRIDTWADFSDNKYAGTVVIWDGSLLNDDNLWGEPSIGGLQLNTWYKFELLFNRKADDSGYEEAATTTIYNADGSMHASVPFTLGIGSRRIVPESLDSFDISWRGGRGIRLDDISIMAPEPGLAVLKGDVDDDGSVNNLDITPFIAALSAADEAAFLTQFPNGNYAAADVDMSGSANNLDITPFIGLLTAAGSNATAVPEPSSLVCVALALMMGRRRAVKRSILLLSSHTES